MALDAIERGLFLRLFNRDGHVLDFSISKLDSFTMSCVGVAVCAEYQLPKAKSLAAYIKDANETDRIKLISSLFEYYETNPAYDREHETEDLQGLDREYHSLYLKCKPIIKRERAGGAALLAQREGVASHFTSDYMNQQIDLLFKARDTNPTEAIGKSKELIESCCKTILEEKNEAINKDWAVQQLVKATMKSLEITTDDINAGQPAGKTIKRILSSLGNIASGVAELRNPYGSGHGKGDSYQGLTVRHARLAVGSAATLVEYLWDAHIWQETSNSN